MSVPKNTSFSRWFTPLPNNDFDYEFVLLKTWMNGRVRELGLTHASLSTAENAASQCLEITLRGHWGKLKLSSAGSISYHVLEDSSSVVQSIRNVLVTMLEGVQKEILQHLNDPE